MMIQKYRVYKLLAGALFLCGANFISLPIVSDAKIKSPNEKEDLKNRLPRRFRATDAKSISAISSNNNIAGLENLRISGSGQLSFEQLKNLVNQTINTQKITPSNFILVDLRGEHHFFLGEEGFPVSFFSVNFLHNFGESTQNVMKDEQEQVKRLLKNPTAIVHYVVEKGKRGFLGQTTETVESTNQVYTEQALAEKLGIKYIRFAVTDHSKPSDEMVDQIIKFITQLPPNAWVHVHCRGGSGRTSTFMVIDDIIKNGKNVSKEEIFKRQIALGGKDLFKIKDRSKDEYRHDEAVKRLEFINQFYKYVRAKDGLGVQPWSSWIKKKTQQVA